jgi:DNA-binding transcriptional LysR family regulator
MDLHKLRIFVAIARLGSFTKAAEYLHMTQPTVSQQLALLESSIGVKLIERDTRYMRLNGAGETLLSYAERLLALADEATEATRNAAGLAERMVRVGVGHTLATYLLPGVLRRYRDQYPNNIASISVGNTSQLLELLTANLIDLALVGSPVNHTDIITEPFMQDKLVVITAPDDEWAKRAEIHLSELADRVLLTREPGSALHASVERLLGAEFLASDKVIRLGETEGIKRSVEAGLGVALIQGIAIQREVEAGNLVALPLQGGDASRTYLVARRRRQNIPTAGQNLVALLKTP